MFGRKKKKEPKVEQVFETAKPDDKTENAVEQENTPDTATEESVQESEPELSEAEREKQEQIDVVKSKISKILQSSNIEIVDENEGDTYEETSDTEKQQQQDYDSLKAIFGDGDKNKKQELTLTIDDYDYTYTGKYVDEYDLVHIKNIKKIKLQRKHSKLTKRLLIAAAAVLTVGIGITMAVLFTRKTPVYLKSISLNHTEQSYFLNTPFEYEGLNLLAEYSDGTVQVLKLNSSYFYDSTGYVERRDGKLYFVADQEATLYFTYSGLQTSIKIHILEKEVSKIYAHASKGFSKLNIDDYITEEDLVVYAKYDNYIFEEKIDFSELTISAGGNTFTKEFDAATGKYRFKITVDFEELRRNGTNKVIVTYSVSGQNFTAEIPV